MKYIITLITIAALGSITYGLTLDAAYEALSHRYIGAGTVSLFLIAMPLFLIKESKGKKVKDYMLTEESVRKMQEKSAKNSENQ